MRAMLSLELVLNRHQMEEMERGLLEKKPSKPKEDRKEWGWGGGGGAEKESLAQRGRLYLGSLKRSGGEEL